MLTFDDAVKIIAYEEGIEKGLEQGVISLFELGFEAETISIYFRKELAYVQAVLEKYTEENKENSDNKDEKVE